MSYNKDLNPINAAVDPNNEGLGQINGNFDSHHPSKLKLRLWALKMRLGTLK